MLEISNCGEITALRVNGKIGTTPRFAWAEFKSLEGMEMALTLDGQVMGSMRVKIQKSRSSIQKYEYVNIFRLILKLQMHSRQDSYHVKLILLILIKQYLSERCCEPYCIILTYRLSQS